MQQNRDRNGRPRNPRPYDLNRDVARTSAPSQNHNTPRSTGNSRYGYNGEPLSRPPSRSANGSVRSSRADNSIQFPTQSQPRRPAQGQGSNTTQYPAGNRPAGSRPKNAKSGGKQRRPANNARSGQSSRKNQNAQNRPNRQHPAGSQSAPQQSPARREMRKKRKVTRATLRRRRILRRLTAFAMLLCVIGAGIYLTMTMLFRINSIQVQTPDGKQVTEIAGYSADSILQRMGVQLEENIFSFEFIVVFIQNNSADKIIFFGTLSLPVYFPYGFTGFSVINKNVAIVCPVLHQQILVTYIHHAPLSHKFITCLQRNVFHIHKILKNYFLLGMFGGNIHRDHRCLLFFRSASYTHSHQEQYRK